MKIFSNKDHRFFAILPYQRSYSTKEMFRHLLLPDEPRGNRLHKANFIAESVKMKNMIKGFRSERIQVFVVAYGERSMDIINIGAILEELPGEIQDEQ